MKLVIFSIMLDAMPFCTWHLPIFNRLNIPWRWIIVEGTAQNNGSTSWCKPQEPRLSRDGTTEYIRSIISDGIIYLPSPSWESKDQMVNMALEHVKEPCVLMQIDSDEIYTHHTLTKIVELFTDDPSLGAIKMFCQFFVGLDLVCEGTNCWSNNNYEWLRAWRFNSSMRFTSHEPPVLNYEGRLMEREESKQHGLSFLHYAYALEKQVQFKQQYYGYSNLVNQWRSLQNNKVWPARLSRFFPFVSGEKPLVNKVS